MPTNVSAEKSAEVRQRQPNEVSLSQDTEAKKHSVTGNDNAKDGRADNKKSNGKRRTRRGGRKRFKKNRDITGDIQANSKDEHAGLSASDNARNDNAGKRKPHASSAEVAHSKPYPKSRRKHEAALGGIYSAIDLGTNNCRLLIAKPTKHGFRVIDAFSRIVRLGEGVGKDNRLSDEAMDRTIEALKVCSEKLARRGVTCMRHVATEACRIADNSEEFVARVKRETGINLDVISAGEEARLAVLGCQSLIAGDKRNALVFDIGGGSTELIWVKVRPGKQVEIKGWVSVPWGVVNLTEAFTTPGKQLKNKEYKEMVESVEVHLRAFNAAHSLDTVLKGRHTQFLGTSGTVTTLASLHLELPRYIRDKVDGAWMKAKDIKALSRRVAEMTPEERAAEPCIGAERADLVVAGCAILEAILGMWQVPSLRVADRGIREGILRGLMQLDQPVEHVRTKKKMHKSGMENAKAANKVNREYHG
ncbi:Ppx/GppA phosphatase family protein [Kordiimonas aquimaris]|uniref:Ppx/GppA phosphatase family protein n=1 Tax=Kordiimonas aquimaris TaxID=707591 RepID=UPI0021CFA819|nr:Ppx/GppA phosphatase family protein [Kordiimonas aquimaris]